MLQGSGVPYLVLIIDLFLRRAIAKDKFMHFLPDYFRSRPRLAITRPTSLYGENQTGASLMKMILVIAISCRHDVGSSFGRNLCQTCQHIRHKSPSLNKKGLEP